MGRSRKLALVGALSVLAVPASAYGQVAHTWLSGFNGDDVNPCSRTAPCKTFPGAISKTVAGGEISALDPGDFGNGAMLSITKPITISAVGVDAVLPAATVSGIPSAISGILINSPAP